MLTARRWLELWIRLGATRQADGVLADAYAGLMERLAEKHRHYHTAHHVGECLAHLDSAGRLCEHAGEVELALWFHDAIYNPRAKDNEAQSAAWAVRVMQDAAVPANMGSNVPAESRARVHGLIMATCHDALPDTPDAQVLVDIDLAILGADAVRFDAYESEVRAEYAFVPDFLFRRTRKKILRGFLDRPTIYSTRYFQEKLEKKARENLARSLAKLDGA